MHGKKPCRGGWPRGGQYNNITAGSPATRLAGSRAALQAILTDNLQSTFHQTASSQTRNDTTKYKTGRRDATRRNPICFHRAVASQMSWAVKNTAAALVVVGTRIKEQRVVIDCDGCPAFHELRLVAPRRATRTLVKHPSSFLPTQTHTHKHRHRLL